MRYLDLVQAGEPIEEAAMEKYAEMFQGLLALGGHSSTSSDNKTGEQPTF
jgi:hypothetical protein